MSAPRRRVRGFFAGVTVLVLGFIGLGACQVFDRATEVDQTTLTELASPSSNSMPATVNDVVLDQLNAPTSLAIALDGTTLFIMGNQLMMLDAEHQPTELSHDLPDIVAEHGLIDLALPDDFVVTQRLYLCYRTQTDLRVSPLRIDQASGQAVAEAPLISGLPLPADDQLGCKLAFGPDQNLYIGTSDGADPVAPQDITKLGGKILRVDPYTRQAPTGNPFIDRTDAISKLVYSYGHRDVTGLAWNPSGAALYAIDRGPAREDEINVIVAGGNYGWHPAASSATSYQTDGVPMTDLAIADARPAAWNSGPSTLELGAALFVTGDQWGALNGDLAVSNGVGPRVLFMQVTGEIVGEPVTLDSVNPVGPSASVAFGPEGDLYVLTASGTNDRLVRVSVVG